MIGRAQARRNADLVITVAVAAVCLLGDLLVPLAAVRAILAVPLCFALPGYVLMTAIFGTVHRERAATWMLICALSLAVLVLGGMALNETPWGIRTATWACELMIVITALAAVTWRRRELAASAGVAVAVGPAWHLTIRRPRTANVVGVLVAAVVAFGAIAASRLPLGAPNANGFESLSLSVTDHGRAVDVRLVSSRQHPASYGFRVKIGSTVIRRGTVRLAPGDGLTVRVPLGSSARTRRVSATAVLAGADHRSRLVTMSLGPSQPG